MKAIGYLNFLAGIIIAILTLSHALRNMDAIVFTFIFGAIITVPALSTYTKLGLNEDVGDQTEESKRRSKLLRSKYPYILLPLIAVAAVYFLIGLLIKDYRIFLLFSSFNCLAAGYWSAWVYPRASELFESLPQYSKSSKNYE